MAAHTDSPPGRPPRTPPIFTHLSSNLSPGRPPPPVSPAGEEPPSPRGRSSPGSAARPPGHQWNRHRDLGTPPAAHDLHSSSAAEARPPDLPHLTPLITVRYDSPPPPRPSTGAEPALLSSMIHLTSSPSLLLTQQASVTIKPNKSSLKPEEHNLFHGSKRIKHTK